MNNFAEGTFQLNIEELQSTWVAFERVTGLRALQTDADHQHALQLMRAMWDVVAEDASHPLSSLFNLLVSMIGEYEKKHYPQPKCEPHEMLEFMMEQADRSALDLAQIVDSVQLEAILAGRKKIDTTLANRLAEYFHVTPLMFLPIVTK